jgi:hypothetical protein
MNQFEQINISVSFSVAVPSNRVEKQTADSLARAYQILMHNALGSHHKHDLDMAVTDIQVIADFESWGKPTAVKFCPACECPQVSVGGPWEPVTVNAADVEG